MSVALTALQQPQQLLAGHALGDEDAAALEVDAARDAFRRLGAAIDLAALDLIDSMVLTSPVALILLSYFLEWAKRG